MIRIALIVVLVWWLAVRWAFAEPQTLATSPNRTQELFLEESADVLYVVDTKGVVTVYASEDRLRAYMALPTTTSYEKAMTGMVLDLLRLHKMEAAWRRAYEHGVAGVCADDVLTATPWMVTGGATISNCAP
jgi:hypothetical protein